MNVECSPSPPHVDEWMHTLHLQLDEDDGYRVHGDRLLNVAYISYQRVLQLYFLC